MKRASFLLAFSFLFLLSVSAQQYIPVYKERGYFFGLGAKTNVFVNNNAVTDINVWKKPSIGGNVFAGKWFNPKIGSRILFEEGTLHPYFQSMNLRVDQNYFLGRLDFLLDFTNFVNYIPDRNYHMIPYIGVSGAYAFNAVNRPDNANKFSSFMFGGGLWNTFDFSRNISGYFSLGLDFVDADFDGYKSDGRKLNLIASLSIGIIYYFNQ